MPPFCASERTACRPATDGDTDRLFVTKTATVEKKCVVKRCMDCSEHVLDVDEVMARSIDRAGVKVNAPPSVAQHPTYIWAGM